MARLKVYRTQSGTRYGVLSGGETQDYSIARHELFDSEQQDCGDTRQWVENYRYAWSFRRVRIAEDVTSIGNHCFAFFNNAEFLFDDPASIRHLGDYAFGFSGIRGKITLPGLTDTVLTTAFQGCTKITELDLTGSAVTVIGELAFSKCHRLKKLSGCGNVREIRPRAFMRCASLESIDVVRNVLATVGYSAFHITSIASALEDCVNTEFDVAATRHEKFDAQTLAAIQAVKLSDVGSVPKDLCEQSLPDLPYGLNDDGSQEYMTSGCAMLSVFHAMHGVFRGVEYADFVDWWGAVNDAYKAENGVYLYETSRGWIIQYRLIALMGLQFKDFSDSSLSWGDHAGILGYYEALKTHDETAKREIAAALEAGYGVLAEISTRTKDEALVPTFANSHMVAIVGCKNGKLVVVDSASIDGESGGVYEVAYEDLFMGAAHARNDIRVILPKGVNT